MAFLAPVEEMEFTLKEVAGLARTEGSGFPAFDMDLVHPILEEAGKLIDKVFMHIDNLWTLHASESGLVETLQQGGKQVVVAQGRVNAAMATMERAVQADDASAKTMLKRDEGILAMRGRWFEWRAEDESLELPAMPTLHPAFLLRQPAAKKKAWSDLVSLVQRLDRPERPH